MQENQPRRFVINKLACFALLIVILAAGNLTYQYRYLRPSDDYFWLMFIANNFVDSDFGEELYQRQQDLVRQRGYSRDAVARVDARRALDENYLLQGLFFVPFIALADGLPLDLAEKTTFVMFGGFISMYALVSALLLLAMWRCNDAAIVLSLVIAIGLIYFIDFAPRPKVYHFFHPGVMGVDLVDQVKHFFARLFHPGPKYVIFNFAPKDRLMVLVTALLLLRWGGSLRLTYLLLPLLFLVHREYTGLLLALFLAIDLVVRPRVVMTSWIAPWVGLFLGLFVVFSVFGRQVDFTPWLAVVPVAFAFAGMAVFRQLEKTASPRLRSLFRRYGAFVGGCRPPVQDIVVFAIIWLATIPLTYAIYRFSGAPLEESGTILSSFLWLLVPTRYLGFFSLAILAFLIWLLLRRLKVEVLWRDNSVPPEDAGGSGRIGRSRVAVSVVLVALVLAPSATFALRQGKSPWALSVQKTTALEATFGQPMTADTWKSDEVKFYYAMFTSLLTDDDQLARLGVP